MNDTARVLLGLFVPVVGTAAGASMVFFLRGEMKNWMHKLLLGFASGVMVAAAFWSLLLPSLELSKTLDYIAWLPTTVGFLAGIGFLLLLDTLIPHLHIHANTSEGKKSSLNKSIMLALAVAMHNLPEGMTVGVVFAGAATENSTLTLAGAFSLAIGIAVQNFPEGAIVSIPLRESGISRARAFTYGLLSGIIEPLGAIVTLLLASLIQPLLPYILAFAAGAMIYVVVEELIPKAQEGEHSNIGIVGFSVGLLLMMFFELYL